MAKGVSEARTFVDLLEADTWVHRDPLSAAMDVRVGWRVIGGEGGGSTEVNLVVVVVV